jgi:hypothetical protein
LQDLDPAGGTARPATTKTGKRRPRASGGLEQGLTWFCFNFFVFRENMNDGHWQGLSPNVLLSFKQNQAGVNTPEKGPGFESIHPRN